MKLFRGIPIHRIIIDISFSCIWALMNAIFANTLANTINTQNKNLGVYFFTYFFLMCKLYE